MRRAPPRGAAAPLLALALASAAPSANALTALGVPGIPLPLARPGLMVDVATGTYWGTARMMRAKAGRVVCAAMLNPIRGLPVARLRRDFREKHAIGGGAVGDCLAATVDASRGIDLGPEDDPRGPAVRAVLAGLDAANASLAQLQLWRNELGPDAPGWAEALRDGCGGLRRLRLDGNMIKKDARAAVKQAAGAREAELELKL